MNDQFRKQSRYRLMRIRRYLFLLIYPDVALEMPPYEMV